MSQPTYSSASAYISEHTLTLVFDVPLDAVNPPQAGAFALQVNGTPVTVTGVTVDSGAQTVILTINGSAFTPGDVIDYVYTDPTAGNDTNAIQGTDGADAASFTHQFTVTIGRPGPSAPATPTLNSGSDSGTLGDGITNHATPTVSGTAAANAVVKLYDTDGTTLLGSITADGSGNWSITSSALSDGSHTLKVTQTDGSGTSPLSTGLALQIDTAAAAPTNLSVAAGSDSGTLGDGISNVGTPHINGHAEAGATVRLYDTDGTTVLGTSTADGSGNWSITSSNLIEGAHTLTAVQTDVAGNVSAASAGFSYTVDTIGPTGMALSTTTAQQSAATNGSTIATLSSTDLTAVTYAFKSGNGTIDADNGKFTISGTDLVASQNLTAGTYHIYLSATDAAGNDAYQIFTIDVVDGPSVASIVRSAAASSTVPASAATVTYTVTFDQSVTGVDASDFTLTTSGNASGTVTGVSGSGNIYQVTVGNVGGDGTLRLDLNASGTGIQNGSSTAIVGGYTAGQTFTLDHTVPAVPAAFTMRALDDTGISSTDGITNVTAPTFSGVAEANATVTLYDTDGTTVLGSTTANGVGAWTITSNTLTAGSHTLTVKQADAAGNVSAASTGLAVTVDTAAAAPAAPALAAPSDSGVLGDNITNVATPTLKGSAEANAVVKLYDSDGVTLLGTTTADGTGLWSITSSTLTAGTHSLTVTQTDQAGNVSSASAALQLTIDMAAPEPASTPVLAPASDSDTAGDGITDVVQPVVGGSAEAHATIKLYDTDGTTLLGTTVADGSGNWSITSATLALGPHQLTVTQTDAAGNVSGASAALNLTIVEPPSAPTIDGVAVTQQTVTLPGGGTGTQTTVPIVTAGRAESSGNAGTADIPLVASGAKTLLLAQLDIGFGLTASGGTSHAAGDPLAYLIQAIKAATPDHTSADQGHLTGNGQSFLDLLPADVPLLVQTVTPVTAPGTSGATLTLTGTSDTSQHTALVVDAVGVGAGNTLALKDVDFAAIIGAATVTGTTSGQVLTGDVAAQNFNVTAAAGGSVFAGGGNDAMTVTSDTVSSGDANAGSAADAGAAAQTLLHGGTGSDTAVFSGARASYTVAYADGHVTVTENGGTHASVEVVNVETLRFADASVAIENRAALTSIAGLYETVLGRQADVGGFAFWGSAEKAGTSLGQIALDMIASTEAHGTFSGATAHDIGVLYQAVFGRAADAGGAAYWLDAMQHGATLAQVADAMLHSTEGGAHVVAPTQWDFLV